MGNNAEQAPRFTQAPETERRGRFLVASSVEISSHHVNSSDAVFSLAEQGLIGLSEGVEESFGGGASLSREAMRLLGRYSREMKGETVSQLSDKMNSVVERIMDVANVFSTQQEIPVGEKTPAAGFVAAKILETQQGTFAVIKSVGSSRALIWRASGRVDFLGTEHGLFEDSELQAKVLKGEITQEEHDAIRNSPTLNDFIYNLKVAKIALEKEIGEILTLEGRGEEAVHNARRLLETSALASSEKTKHRLKLLKLFELFKQYPSLRSQKTQVLGSTVSERANIHTVEEKMQPGDRLILASGIEGLLPSEVSGILLGSKTLQEGLDALRLAASERNQDPLNRLAKNKDVTLTGIATSQELAPGIRKPFGPRKISTEGRRLHGQGQESLPEVRIRAISEALAKTLDLADIEQDPEILALMRKIKEEKQARDDFKEITDTGEARQFNLADLRRVPTLAKGYFRALKGSLEVRKNSEGDALTKWEEHIKRLERELQLLKLRKEHGEE